MNSALEAQIIANEDQLLEAMRTNNVDRLESLLHGDLLFNGPTGETATKAMDLSNYRSGGVKLDSLIPSDRQMSEIVDTVVVAVTVAIQGNYSGQEINGKFRYLRVWKQFEEGWKVIAGSVIPLP
jgi:Domain of unknown function (DUF4440)